MEPAVIAALIVGILAPLFTLVGVVLTNRFEIRKQKARFEHEQRTEEYRWLSEIYANCIYYCSGRGYYSVGAPVSSQAESINEYQKLELECKKLTREYDNNKNKWLRLLSIYYPYKETPEYRAFMDKYEMNKVTSPDVVALVETSLKLSKRGRPG